MNIKVLHCLKNARALIAKPDHWIQGSMVHWLVGNKGQAFCLVGAVRESASRLQPLDWHQLKAVTAYELEHQLGLSFADPQASVIDWNDYRGRTHADVLLLMDAAIARLEAQLL